MKKIVSLEEYMDAENVDVSSFKFHDELNTKFWSTGKKLDPVISQRLLKIASQFFENLDLPSVQIKDIRFTGSLANYNWSNYSDVDLHIVVNFADVDENEDIVRDMLNAQKALWNKRHDIKIFGFEVEIYVENEGETHHSSGVYSILNNSWVVEPQPQEPQVDWHSVKAKAASFMDQIDRAKLLYSEANYEEALATSRYLSDRIKNYRRAGLDSPEGEFSVENLVFKVLRRNESLKDLMRLKVYSYDAVISVQDKQRPPEGNQFYGNVDRYTEQAEPPQDRGKFQRAVKRKHSRNRLTTKGKRRKSAPFTVNPPKQRGKSAPPIGEVEQLQENVVESPLNYWSERWEWLVK